MQIEQIETYLLFSYTGLTGQKIWYERKQALQANTYNFEKDQERVKCFKHHLNS